MTQSQRQSGNSQTLCIELSDLQYSAVEQADGHCTVLKFKLHNFDVKMGDVLLVLEGAEIRFHGMIAGIEPDGWAVASDRRGSTIPAMVQ